MASEVIGYESRHGVEPQRADLVVEREGSAKLSFGSHLFLKLWARGCELAKWLLEINVAFFVLSSTCSPEQCFHIVITAALYSR
jgi:hypothetical protein